MRESTGLGTPSGGLGLVLTMTMARSTMTRGGEPAAFRSRKVFFLVVVELRRALWDFTS